MRDRFPSLTIAIILLSAIVSAQQPDLKRAIELLDQARAILLGTSAPTTTTTIPVHAGDNLQAALDAAKPGDTLVLDAGAVFHGGFTLPAKIGDGWITITSAAAVGQSGPGQRVSPSEPLAELWQSGLDPIVATAPKAHHWRLERLRWIGTVGGRDLVTLGDGSSAQRLLTDVPHDLVLDRIDLRGDPVLGAKRGIALNSATTTIVNSRITDIKTVGQDSQAICGWNGPGPFVIENNRLEASGENILFGGADPSIAQLMPSDITIRGNVFEKPASWKGGPWQIKNLFELKNARRVTIAGNVFTRNWAHAQVGYAILFTVRNQDGGCPWCTVQAVTFQRNIIRDTDQGLSITGVDDIYLTTTPSGPFAILDNLFADVRGNWLQLTNGPMVGLDFERNTADQTGNLIAMEGPPSQGATFIGNAGNYGSYAIHGADRAIGKDSLNFYLPGATWTNNAIVGGPVWMQGVFPAGTIFPATLAGAGVDPALLPDEAKVLAGR